MNPDKAVGISSDSAKAATTSSGVAVAVIEPEQINQIHNESQDDEKNINGESSSVRESLCMQQQEPGPSGLVVSRESHCGIKGGEGGVAEEGVDGKSTVAKAELSFGHGTPSSPQLQQQIGKENAREPKRVETCSSAKTAVEAHEKAAADRASAEHSLVSVELSKRAVVPKCALNDDGSESTKSAIKTNSEDKVVITATGDKCRYASAFVQLVASSVWCSNPPGLCELCVVVVLAGNICLNWLINYIHRVNSMNDWRSPSP